MSIQDLGLTVSRRFSFSMLTCLEGSLMNRHRLLTKLNFTFRKSGKYHNCILFNSLESGTRSRHCVPSGDLRCGRNACWDINVLDSRDAHFSNAPNH